MEKKLHKSLYFLIQIGIKIGKSLSFLFPPPTTLPIIRIGKEIGEAKRYLIYSFPNPCRIRLSSLYIIYMLCLYETQKEKDALNNFCCISADCTISPASLPIALETFLEGGPCLIHTDFST